VVEERSAFVASSPVMGRHPSERIASGLIEHHLDEVGEMFSFWSQFDDRLFDHGLHGNPARHNRAKVPRSAADKKTVTEASETLTGSGDRNPWVNSSGSGIPSNL
jgi:hypothetical protein